MTKIGVCRFHPTEPVLACSVNGKVILLSADNSSVPFSNWKKEETQLKLGNYRRLESIKIEWNVSKLNIYIRFSLLSYCTSTPEGSLHRFNQQIA
jgi:hypothetical protein